MIPLNLDGLPVANAELSTSIYAHAGHGPADDLRASTPVGFGEYRPADGGDGGFQAQAADSDLELAVVVGVTAADGAESEVGAGEGLDEQRANVGFGAVSADGLEAVVDGDFGATVGWSMRRPRGRGGWSTARGVHDYSNAGQADQCSGHVEPIGSVAVGDHPPGQ
jgi:hypothetical protein